MSTEQSRADFEDWIINLSKGCADLHVNILGNYDDPVIISYWEAWQASRAALVVSIDQHTEFEIAHIASPSEEKDTYAIGWIDGRNYAAKQVRAAGITVKEGGEWKEE